MPASAQGTAGLIYFVVLLVVIGVVVFRNSRPRRLRVEALWVRPLIILLSVALYYRAFPARDAVEMEGAAAAFVVGAAVGWWRGRFVRIEVDPATHLATQQASVLGMLLILGIFIVRFGLRSLVLSMPAGAALSANAATGWLLVFAVGMIATTQIEIWLRARRLIAEAKGG